MENSKNIKILDFIIIGVISLVFFACPLFFTGLAAQGVGFEKMMLFYFLVLVGTVAWATKGIAEGELKIKRTPLDLPIISIISIFIISTIFSVSSQDSLIGSYGNSAKGLIAALSFALFYYLVVNNVNAKKIKMMFWLFLSSSSLIIIYSLLQVLGIFVLPLSFTKITNFNPLGSLSSLTMFSVMVLPLLIIGASQISEIHSKLKNKAFLTLFKIILIAVAVATLAILTLLKGFTFWPAAIIAMVIVLMFLMSKIVKIKKNNLAIPLIAFLVLIILLVLGNFNIISLNLPSEVSLSRSLSWDIAKDSLAKDPFFGSGPSTFYYSFSKYKSLDFNESPLWNIRFDSASGVLFEMLANIGAVGTILVIILTLIALSLCFITIIKTENKEIQSISLATFSSFVVAIIFSLLFTVNNSFILLSVLIACLAVVSSINVYHEKLKTINLSLKASPKYALALSAIFLSVSAGVVILFTMGGKMYLADIYVKDSLLSEDVDEKILKLQEAVVLAPYQDVYYTKLANNYIILANQKASEGDENFSEYLKLAIDSAKKAVEISPKKAINNESLALIYENSSFYVRGSLEWAESYYKKLADLDPSSPMVYVRLALIDMTRSNEEEDAEEKKYNIAEAIKKYDKAIELKPDLSSAYYGKSVAHERSGNIDEAIEQLKRAVLTSSENMDYRFELGRLYFNRGMSQANLAQNASEDIAIDDMSAEEGEESNDLSVEQVKPSTTEIKRNDDISLAEQFFLSILQVAPNHANARYSLAVLYKKIGEKDNAKIMVDSLLEALPSNVSA
ncbi:MAG: tetratricopeptide repeat protein, partial [Candidatus Falkowbacteria bacterium]